MDNTVLSSLKHLAMYDSWLFNGNGFTPNYIKEAVYQRTKHIFIEEWYDNKNDHNYCRIHNVIKNDRKFGQYPTDLNFSQRVSMCKFRCRSNYLPFSQSRFIDDILVGVGCFCPFCPGQIGNEKQYPSFSAFFYEERQTFIRNIPVY